MRPPCKRGLLAHVMANVTRMGRLRFGSARRRRHVSICCASSDSTASSALICAMD